MIKQNNNNTNSLSLELEKTKAELKIAQNNSKWLGATLKGLIKEANNQIIVIPWYVAQEFKIDSDKLTEWLKQDKVIKSIVFKPWQNIHLPEDIMKEYFPHEFELAEIMKKRQKEVAEKS